MFQYDAFACLLLEQLWRCPAGVCQILYTSACRAAVVQEHAEQSRRLPTCQAGTQCTWNAGESRLILLPWRSLKDYGNIDTCRCTEAEQGDLTCWDGKQESHHIIAAATLGILMTADVLAHVFLTQWTCKVILR